jgi:SAM-dependent methyltransferase
MRRVRELARKRRLDNVQTIQSDCETGLPAGSVDVVLLYDIYHMLSEPDAVLAELHRVLKGDGTLSLLDPHMREEDLVSGVTQGGMFALASKGARTYRFARQ